MRQTKVTFAFFIGLIVLLLSSTLPAQALDILLPNEIENPTGYPTGLSGPASSFWRVDFWDTDGFGVGSDPSASIAIHPTPLGDGFNNTSLRMDSGPGTGGAGCGRLGGKVFFGTQALAGRPLSDLTELSYFFLIDSNSGVPAAATLSVYINIFVDNNNDGVWNGAVDSILFYEPYYAPSVAPGATRASSDVFLQDTWYFADAIGAGANGRWHYAAQQPIGNPGLGLFTPTTVDVWTDFIGAIGSLEIVNPPASGCGVHGDEGTTSGLVIVVGQKSGAPWDNYVAHLDRVTIGFSGAGGFTETFDISNTGYTLAFNPNPPTATTTCATNFDVIVEIRDASNTVVTGATDAVTLAIASGPSGAVLSGTTTVNAVNGVATFSNMSLDLVGAYTLNASAAGFTTVTSTSITVNNGVNCPILAFNPNPPTSSVECGVPFDVVVELQDNTSMIIPTATNSITLSLASAPVGGSLSGTTTINAVAGVATFSNMSLNVAGAYTFNAGGTGLTSITSAPVTVIVGAGCPVVIDPPPVAPPVTNPADAWDIQITATPLVYRVGDTVTFTITVRKLIGGTPVQVDFPVPSVYSIQSVSPSRGIASATGQIVTYNDDIQAGESGVITVVTRAQSASAQTAQSCIISPVTKCATITLNTVAGLPATGETPLWRDWLMTVVLVGGVLMVMLGIIIRRKYQRA